MNLVDEFFKRNLSESESKTLDQLLEHSPEEAARFAARMESEYFSLGLPAPQMPSHLITQIPSALLSPWMSTLAAGAFLSAAALTWALWPSPKANIPAPVPAAPQAVAAIAQPLAKALLAPPPAVPEAVTGETHEGNRLNVVVDLDAEAPVKVCVLNLKEQSVRLLYEGTLQAGRWSLKWDGKLADGSRAPAGDYRIAVESGSHRMVRTVSVASTP